MRQTLTEGGNPSLSYVHNTGCVIADFKKVIQALGGFRSAKEKVPTGFKHAVNIGDDLLL